MADFDQTQKLVNENNNGELSIAEKVDKLMEAFEAVNTYYIKCIAEQIKVIGEMNPASINRLTIMAQMNENIASITAQLHKAVNYTTEKMTQVFLNAFEEVHGDRYFERVLTNDPLTEQAKARIEKYAEMVSRQTAQTFENFSNTTAISQQYKGYIDRAVLAVSSGIGSHTEQLRQVVMDLGSNGMQVFYESGYHRRLDSAARQNIVSAAHQIAQQGSDIMSEATGCDAKEISVHLNPAPDHAPVQGHVFLLTEFDMMQAGGDFQDINGVHFKGFRRPIGEWNCLHYAMGFHTDTQKPKYTQAQLNDILAKNREGFDWSGKHYTRYQGVQMMRKLETKVRRQKDIAVAAKASGDDALRAKCQQKIDALFATYQKLSQVSGVPMKPVRMQVQGFTKYKLPKKKK